MRQASIVSPLGLTNAFPAYFPSTGTIKARGGVLTAGTEGAFADVASLVDIPCMVATNKTGAAVSGDFIVTERSWTAILDGYYESLHTATVALHFVVNSIEYGAVVDSDSQGAYTRLRLTLDET